MRVYFTISNGIFKFNVLAVVVSEISGGPEFTLRPHTPPSGKILTHPKYLPIPIYITVKVQRRSSINVRLTEGSLYNPFHIVRSPKMGFWGDFWCRCDDIWWESTFVLRIAHFQTSLIQI